MDVLAAAALDVVVRVTIVLSLAWGVAWLLRERSAAARHAVWGAALVAAAAMPAIVALAPRVAVPWFPAAATVVRLPDVPVGTTGGGQGSTRVADGTPIQADAPAAAVARQAAPAPRAEPVPWSRALAGVWGIGAIAALVLLLRRVRATRRVVSGAHSDVPAAWREAAAFAERAVAPGRRYRLAASGAVKSPWVWDPGRARVVVPSDVGAWDAARCRAAMVHELAHVRRRDGQVWLCGAVAGVVLWFHPLVWLARRRLFAEQERACDDAVLRAGCAGSEYAEHLLALSGQGAIVASAVAMARPSEMAARVTHLLDPTQRRSQPSRRTGVLLGVPLLVLWSCVGAAELDSAPRGEAAASEDPQQDPRAAVWERLPALDDPTTHDAAVAALVDCGEAGVPHLALALEEAAALGPTPRTRGILQVIATLGESAEAARPAVEPLASTTIPMRKLAIATLAAMRGEAGWTWAADYSENRIVAFDAEGREAVSIDDVFGVWDVDLLEDGSVLVTEFALNRVRELGRDGTERWVYDELRNPYSAQRLPNGNTLIANTFGGEVVEVDRAGEVVWRFYSWRPYDAERLANGNTLVAGNDEGNVGQVREVAPDGTVVREVGGLVSVHDVDLLANGNLLVVERQPHRVQEIDWGGNVIWQVSDVNSPSDADRLPNGHTIVAENGGLREYDRDGMLVWRKAMAWAVEVNRY